jgi:prophage regulatory protein
MTATTEIVMIGLAEVKRRTSLSKSLIYALISSGKFPRSRKLAAKRTAWVAAEVNDWLITKVQQG